MQPINLVLFVRLLNIQWAVFFLKPPRKESNKYIHVMFFCGLLYTSDAADYMQCVDLDGLRIIKKIVGVFKLVV